MLKKVVFLGLAATAVAMICAVKHAAHYHHHDEIKAKSRKNSVVLNKNKTVDKPVKAPAGRRQTCPVVDINALRSCLPSRPTWLVSSFKKECHEYS